jgi:hypothetical protein
MIIHRPESTAPSAGDLALFVLIVSGAAIASLLLVLGLWKFVDLILRFHG